MCQRLQLVICKEWIETKAKHDVLYLAQCLHSQAIRQVHKPLLYNLQAYKMVIKGVTWKNSQYIQNIQRIV